MHVFNIKVLDFKYLSNFDHLKFTFLTYRVTASNEKEAIEEARIAYMQGEEPLFCEEIPILIKLFSIMPHNALELS